MSALQVMALLLQLWPGGPRLQLGRYAAAIAHAGPTPQEATELVAVAWHVNRFGGAAGAVPFGLVEAGGSPGALSLDAWARRALRVLRRGHSVCGPSTPRALAYYYRLPTCTPSPAVRTVATTAVRLR